MPLTVEDRGQRNQLLFTEHRARQVNLHVVFSGDDSVLEIGEDLYNEGGRIELGDRSRVRIGWCCALLHIEVYARREGVLEIGDLVVGQGRCRFLMHEPGRIRVGEKGQLAGGIELTVSDMHPIFDLASGRRINPAQDVVLGERVWLGEHVTVQKGAVIGHDCIIGARSVVTGEIPPHSIAVGAPARVVRSGVVWRPQLEIESLPPQS